MGEAGVGFERPGRDRGRRRARARSPACGSGSPPRARIAHARRICRCTRSRRWPRWPPGSTRRAAGSPLIDARRGEVFAALYDGERAVGRRSSASPEAVAERVRAGRQALWRRATGRYDFGRPSRRPGSASLRTIPRSMSSARLHVCRLAADVRPAPPEAVLPVLPESTRREATVSRPLTIRRLIYADLPQVIAIERRAFPTPWSLAMFVLELSKPSGICLAALDGDERSSATCVCSRYDTVWHLMNVAVDARAAARGHRHRAARAAVRRGRQARRAVHARGAALERGRDRALRALRLPRAGLRKGYYHDNKEDALIMWRTVGRGAAGRRPRDPRRSRRAATTPAPRVVTDGRRGAARTWSPRRGCCTRATAAWCRRSRRAGTSSWSTRCSTDALERGRRRRSTTSTRVAVTQRPGPDRRAAGRAVARPRRWPPRAGCRSTPVDHLHGPRARQHARRRARSSRRSCAWSRAAATRSSRASTSRARTRCSADARRRRRRGVRQGRALLGLGYPGGPLIRPAGARAATRRRSTSRARCPGELDFSFSGLKTSLLYRVRDLGEADAERAPTWRRRTSGRSSTRSRRARAQALEREGARAARDRRRRGGELGRCASGRGDCERLGVAALGARRSTLCTDNAAMIAGAARFLEPIAVPGLPGARRGRAACLGARFRSPAGAESSDPARAPSAAARRPRCRPTLRRADQLLALRVEELVHEPDVVRGAVLVLGAVAVGRGRRSGGGGSRAALAPARRCRRAPSPRRPARRRGPARPRPPGRARPHLLARPRAVVADAEDADQRPERQPLPDDRHQDHRRRRGR